MWNKHINFYLLNIGFKRFVERMGITYLTRMIDVYTVSII